MAVAIRSSTKAYSAAAQTLAVNTPAGAAEGDMLVAFLFADGGGGASFNWTAAVPADWTPIQAAGPTGGGMFSSFRRTLPSGSPPASYTFDMDYGSNLAVHGFLVCLNPSGAVFDTAGMSINKNGAASVTVLTTGAVTGVATDSVLLCAWTATSNRVISLPPASMIEQQFSNQTTGDAYVYSQLTPGAGSINKSATWDGVTSILAQAVLIPMVTGLTITNPARLSIGPNGSPLRLVTQQGVGSPIVIR